MEYSNAFGFKKEIALSLLLAVLAAPAWSSGLDAAIAAAIEDDPWLKQSSATERATRAEAIAAGELPDPRVSATIANLPTDSFNFSQEPMTQVSVGVMQSFPGGETRVLRRKRLSQVGDISPVERAVRAAQLRREISLLWIDAALADETIKLIENDRALFEQLEQVTRASYGNASIRVNQQDLVRAQLEITRLDERILRLTETRQRRREQLSEWVPTSFLADQTYFEIPTKSASREQTSLTNHAEVRLFDQRIEIARTEREIADESRRPGWTLSASYGFRDEDAVGRNLPDFVSIGVSMDLPLFTVKRQDKQVLAAAERAASAEAARLLRLRQLSARLRDARARLTQLDQQAALYRQTLLSQMEMLAQSSLNAYTSDEGDFAEVMRAYIAQLNARVEATSIEAERQKTITLLEYLTTEVNPEGKKS